MHTSQNTPDSSATRNRRVSGVIRAMLLSNGLHIAVQLAMVPILLATWGSSVYGEWVILSTIPGYLALSDMGIITTAGNRIEFYCTKKQFLPACRVYATSLLLLGIITVCGGALLFTLWIFASNWIMGLFEQHGAITVAAALAALYLDTMLALFFNHSSSLYRTIKRYDWTVCWQSACRAVPYSVLCGAALSGIGMLGAICWMLAARLLLSIALVADVAHRMDWIRASWMKAQKSQLSNLVYSSIGFVALPVSNIVTLHTTTILVAAATTPTTVALYSSIRTLTRFIPQIVSIAGRSVWSESARAFAAQDAIALHSMAKMVRARTCALTMVAILGYLAFGEIVYAFWTGGNLEFDRNLFIPMLMNSAAIALHTSFEVFALATNRVATYSLFFLTTSIIQVAIGWMLFDIFGPSSFPILGLLGSLAIAAFAYIRFLRPLLSFEPG